MRGTENCSQSEVVLTNYGDGERFSLIMGIASAKSRSVRGVSQQLASMGSCLTISNTCLLSHVLVSFVFLMFTVFSFQEK